MSDFRNRLYSPLKTRASSIDSLSYTDIQSSAADIFGVTLDKPYVSGIFNGFTGTSLNFYDYFPKIIYVVDSNNNNRINNFNSLLENAIDSNQYEVSQSGNEAYFYIE